MFSLLDMYIARTLLSTTAISLTVLVGLSSLIKFIEQMKNIGRGSFDMTVAGVYVLLSLPRELEQFFPMATMLGGLIGMGMLASHSELVVMQAAGQSRWDIIKSAMKSALVMVVFVMALGEWVAPVSEAKAKEIRTQAISGGSLFSSDNLVWAKDGDSFVSIGEVLERNRLRDVSIYEFDAGLTLTRITTAKQADFAGGEWSLTGVQVTNIGEQNIDNQAAESQPWVSSLTPDKLGVVTVKPEALSIRGLTDYVNYLENNSQDTNRYELALWRKILQPISVTVMLLMAVSFVFGPLRSVTMGARIIMGVLAGFAFFITNQLFGNMIIVYQLPAILGAIVPSMLFGGVASYILRR